MRLLVATKLRSDIWFLVAFGYLFSAWGEMFVQLDRIFYIVGKKIVVSCEATGHTDFSYTFGQIVPGPLE